MEGELSQSDGVAVRAVLWRPWIVRAALAVLGLAVLHCWFWVVTIGMAFGPHPTIRPHFLGGLVGLTLLVAVAFAVARGPAAPRAGLRTLWAVAAIWMLASLAMWGALASPFSRGVAIALFYAVTNLWLLWAWLMFFVPWPWLTRLAVLSAFVALAGCFFCSVRVAGIDGAALPRIVWRLAEDESRAIAAANSAIDLPSETANGLDEGDYPRFRGADGLGTTQGARLARTWTADKPRLRWRHAVGAGWGSFAIAGRHALTQEQRADEECVVCYDRASGRELWAHRDRAHYRYAETGDGPRATPTVDGSRVYALGATGILNCLDRETGTCQWKADILADNSATAPPHGMTGSPLVVGDRVVVCAGGTKGASLVAYDKATGQRLWHAGNDSAGYTSPLLTRLAGVPQILIITTQSLDSHDVEAGEILWSFPWSNDQRTNCSQPVPVGENRVFASTDYGTGCALLELQRREGGPWNIAPVWSSRSLQTKFSSVVVHQGHAFGFDDGILECVSLEDGRRRWKRGRYGHGQLLLADDLLVIQAEDGRVALVEARPDKQLELCEFQAIDGKTWNYPALAGRQLFVRNDHEAACYELPVEAR